MSTSPRALLLGHPVGHSASPKIMAALSKASGKRLDYSVLEVLPKDLSQTINKICLNTNIIGLNFTLPHKVEAARLSEKQNEDVPLIGSANMWARTSAGFCAYNTDGPGFVKALEHRELSPRNRNIIILGAGGAARGISYACLRAGAKHLFVLNRSIERAKSLQSMAPDKITILDAPEKLPPPCSLPPLFINSTSLGLKERDAALLKQSILPIEKHLPPSIATDLVYSTKNKKTPFLALAENLKHEIVDTALPMLALQAVEAFNIWMEHDFSTAEALELLLPVFDE